MNRHIVIIFALLFLSVSCNRDKSSPMSNNDPTIDDPVIDKPRINYIPLAVGNLWIYDASYTFQARSSVKSVKGEESWEIISCEDSSHGKLLCQFKGNRYNLQMEELPPDTVTIEPLEIRKEFLFLMKDSSFTISPIDTSELETLDQFSKFTLDNKLITCFPSPSPLKIERHWCWEEVPGFDRNYTILKNVGIKEFLGADLLIWGGFSLKYSLKKFTNSAGVTKTFEN